MENSTVNAAGHDNGAFVGDINWGIYDFTMYNNNKKKLQLKKSLKQKSRVTFKDVVQIFSYNEKWSRTVTTEKLHTEEEQAKRARLPRNN